tara:strand:+ start:4336 stop:5106 length:771 start_codon:yes stop_codon:yes gene_type:complete
LSNSIFKNNALSGKRILITGASSGIGEATAYQLADCGASLILVGRNKNKLTYILENLKGSKHEILLINLLEKDSLFHGIKKLNKSVLPLDGAFHSAGKELIKLTRLTNSDDFDSIMMPSATSALSLARAISSKGIMSNKGSVVFMSSVAAITGTSGMAAYSASKGAIESMSRSLSAELAPRGIRVNTLISGAINSPMHKRLLNNLSLEGIKEYEKKHPLGFGQLEDISNLATFLLSDASRWISGSTVTVDGGYSAI